MKYKSRLLEKEVTSLFNLFPVVFITGPRQSGKTTLLKHFIDNDKDWAYYNLDDINFLYQIKEDPSLFVNSLNSNVVIDEAQRSPDIFPLIKSLVDKGFRYKIILSGSANFLLLKYITESLAGRVGILELFPFSLSEAYCLKSNQIIEKIIDSESINDLKSKVDKIKNNFIEEDKLLEFILYGGYPKIYNLSNKKDSWRWFSNYIATYVERDLRELSSISDLQLFQKIHKMFAFQTANVFNMTSIANDSGVSVPTIKRYLSILDVSYQHKLLSPYYKNQRKQVTKSSKIFNVDTGIANYFLYNDQVDKMLNAGYWGKVLETFVYSEIYKSIKDRSPRLGLYYWRTHNGAEVDFVIEKQDQLIPIEVKASSQIKDYELRGLKSFIESQNGEVPFGIVLYRGKDIFLVKENVIVIPLRMFF